MNSKHSILKVLRHYILYRLMPRVKLPSLQRKPQIISIIRWQNTSMEGRNEMGKKMGKKMGKDDKDLNGLKCHTRKKLTLNFSK